MMHDSNNNNNKDCGGKRVAIIGSGPAGIVAAKSSLEAGLIPTVFEKNNDIAGCWNPITGKMYDTMQTNVTRYIMHFSDFPYPPPQDKLKDAYIDYHLVYKYFKDYANNFNLINYIKLNSNVIKVEKIKNKNDNNDENVKFKVTWIDTSTPSSNISSEIFDFLIVATGLYSKPNYTSLVDKELKSFTGKISHSIDYKNNDRLKGKNVLVVGTSISGCEIASEISKVTNKCIVLGHHNLWVFKKYFKNNINLNGGKTTTLDYLSYKRSKSYDTWYEPNFDESIKKYINFCKILCPKQNKDVYPKSKIGVSNFNIKFSISEKYVEQIENNSITPYTGYNSNIVSCDGNSITFKNALGETSIEHNIDEIILCTGYFTDLSFLDKSIQDDIDYKPFDQIKPIGSIYKECFVPKLKNAAFISYFKGNFIPKVELLSRWVTMVFSNKLEYPNIIETKDDVKNIQFNHLSFLEPVVSCDLVAKEIGCCPDFNKLKNENPKLYDILWNGQYSPACYRLSGFACNYNLANEILLNLPKF